MTIDAAAHKRKYQLLLSEKKSKTHGNQGWLNNVMNI
jgi:hypothetical protein